MNVGTEINYFKTKQKKTLPCKQIWLLLFKIEMKQKVLQLQDYEVAPTTGAGAA